ncbi:nucleotidyl transferase AbiEii/AbiGii toxin family protein [Candidatus Neptunochlamydia vexilliferae]|uniref:Nucleotidyl transferase AbiEii/AbiGii toxin family protein n=1 Tax=Candidatus Neptunichlamydia vexilliferae TaxID=1651774 RepID=A0ABS0AYI4_9BACT|nr:nucleotidyl transferase AbiEii/AbiGii toxin family protein [Candidatus Neptunochlamydia vexilliferae]MBF5058536.1 hypothetical protein [Candidatus Neptunochlamydia vexilliferae]
MKSIEQSIKEKIKVLAKERNTPFSQLWRNLILERFLTRLCKSPFRSKFILKGGTLLAKYLPIGRETKDLDFFVDNLSLQSLAVTNAIKEICQIDLQDHFMFELVKAEPLTHPDKPYPGTYLQLLAKFGATKTYGV